MREIGWNKNKDNIFKVKINRDTKWVDFYNTVIKLFLLWSWRINFLRQKYLNQQGIH